MCACVFARVRVCGAQVGCGKTSLLMALLSELPADSGSVTVTGKVAYVPQDAWITSGTVRDNIILGLPFDAEWYGRVVEACCLLPGMCPDNERCMWHMLLCGVGSEAVVACGASWHDC